MGRIQLVTTSGWGDSSSHPPGRAFSLDYRLQVSASKSQLYVKLSTLGAALAPFSVRGELMAASVWSGYLTFGLISMPVRLFSGARSSGISFHMLHRDDMQRIKQQLYCPADNRVVERSEIVKGYEYRKDEYVVIEPEEIKKIEPKTAKSMEILEFVKHDEIDPIYFETSYYLVPEDAGKKPYALLTRALEESSHVAIAKLSMHNREY